MDLSDSQQIPIRSLESSSNGNANTDGDHHHTDPGVVELSRECPIGNSDYFGTGNANTDGHINELPTIASNQRCEDPYLPTSDSEDEDPRIIHLRHPFLHDSVAPRAYDGWPLFLFRRWWNEVDFANPNSWDLLERANAGQLPDSEVPFDGLPRLQFTHDGTALLFEDGERREIPELFGHGPSPTPSDEEVEFWPESGSLSGSDSGSDSGSYSPSLRSQSPCSSSNESDVSAEIDARRRRVIMEAFSQWNDDSGHGAYQRMYNRRLYGHEMRRRTLFMREGYRGYNEDAEDDEFLD